MNVEGLAGNFHAVAPDLPGHGDSGLPRGFTIGLRGFSSFIEQLRDALAPGDIILVGHSIAGSIGMYYAATYPGGISRLVLIDSPITARALYWPLSLTFLDTLLSLYYPFRGRGSYLRMITSSVRYHDRLPSEFLEAASTQASKILKQVRMETTRMVRTLDLGTVPERIELPVMVIWGERDGTVKPGEALNLLERIRDVRLHVLSDCDHYPPYEQPETVNELIENFIRETF
ncbi:MAG: alpha/beta hydrolase [Actinomycetota bacterium]|nr:alpha/beta hydrolase [Actinomycetota bacterium]